MTSTSSPPNGNRLAELRALCERLLDVDAELAVVRGALWNLRDPIVVCDDAGVVRFANKLAKELFGYSDSDVTGRPLVDLIPERFRAVHLEGFARYLETGESKVVGHVIEVPALHADGHEFQVSVGVSVHSAADGRRMFTAVLREVREGGP